MRIVAATTVLPRGRTGGEVVTSAIFDAIRLRGHDLSVAGYVRPAQGIVVGPDEVAIGDRPIETDGNRGQALRWYARALRSGEPYSLAKYAADGADYTRWWQQQISAPGVDLCIIDHAQMAWLAEGLDKPFVYVAHNVEAALYRTKGLKPGDLVRRREARLIDRVERDLAVRAKSVWVLTRDDEAEVTSWGARDVRLLEVPSAFRRRATEGGVGKPSRSIRLLGTWDWAPNALGLRWFLDDVLPLLPSDLTIEIGGRQGAHSSTDPRVSFLGFVDDAEAFLADAKVVVIPSTDGAGVQVKTIDAISCARAVVVTPAGVRGLGNLPDTVTVTADAAVFAQAIGSLLERESAVAAGDWGARRREAFGSQIGDALAAAVQ